MNNATKWDPVLFPWIVRVYFKSSMPGMFGWDSATTNYATLDEALTVLCVKMPRGTIKVVVECAKEREIWGMPHNPNDPDSRTFGYFEKVCSRKPGKQPVWAKGWNEARAREIAAWYEAKK